MKKRPSEIVWVLGQILVIVIIAVLLSIVFAALEGNFTSEHLSEDFNESLICAALGIILYHIYQLKYPKE
jgi:hypothetical protein